MFLNRSASRFAKDIALQHGPARAGSFQKRIVGIERIVAEVFASDSVEIIRAAPRDNLDIAALAEKSARDGIDRLKGRV